MFEQKSLQEAFDYIKTDRDENRFVARVFFLNNLQTYFSFVRTLSEIADITIHLSDYCKGADTVPDLEVLISYLNENKDKDILIPHIGEYLRIGEMTERKSAYIHSILNRHVHSKKRVWIPIFLAKSLFQSIVGPLDEERFGHSLIDVYDNPVDFTVTVYSKVFAEQNGIADAVGIREWLSLWDNLEVKSGMSFATRQIKQITPTNGDYTIKVVADPFEYLKNAVADNNKLSKDMGTDEQWISLIPFVSSNIRMDRLILDAFNMQKFDPYSIINNWQNRSANEKWIFKLWYQLGLNNSSDYISFAVDQSDKYDDLLESVECAIIDCQNSPNFDEWLQQRYVILKKTGYKTPNNAFFEKFDLIDDAEIKLKILTGLTHDERTKILEIVSRELKSGKSIDDFKVLLQEKYPDLLLYLGPSDYLPDEVNEYMTEYKLHKIEDKFSHELSDRAGQMNCYQFDTRGQILNSLKNSVVSPHFIWFDGLGIEWIDMLLEKIKFIDSNVVISKVDIGTAVLPTITKINMAKADPETTGDKIDKINDLDNISHVKDKSDLNYFSIVARQFKLMDKFAQIIVERIKTNPDKEIIVTADHGLSRMATISFHSKLTIPVSPPSEAEVYSYGRYCEFPEGTTPVSVSNTKPDGNILAFSTHNYFTFSGNPMGEIHGGASPEEWLVPIIHFEKYNQQGTKSKSIKPKCINYTFTSSEVYLDADNSVTLTIVTEKPVNSLVVYFKGNPISAVSDDMMNWSVKIRDPDLSVDKSYIIHIYPNNNISNKKEDAFTIKRKGLDIDDDF